MLRPQRISPTIGDNGVADESVAGLIARRLVEEGLCREELPPAAVLDLVDVHARGKAGARGIDFDRLFSTTLSGYEIERVFTSDYLGASLRITPVIRRLVDGVGRMIEARSGSLVSCLLRKPKETL